VFVVEFFGLHVTDHKWGYYLTIKSTLSVREKKNYSDKIIHQNLNLPLVCATKLNACVSRAALLLIGWCTLVQEAVNYENRSLPDRGHFTTRTVNLYIVGPGRCFRFDIWLCRALVEFAGMGGFNAE